jgi:hypothetical protein
VVTNNTGFRLGQNPDTVRGPDVAVVLNAEIPPDFEGTYQEIPPTIAA